MLTRKIISSLISLEVLLQKNAFRLFSYFHHNSEPFRKKFPILEFKPYGLRYAGIDENLKERDEKYTLTKCMFCNTYHLNVLINGIEIPVKYDTGASNLFLTPKDAEKLGLNIGQLDYTISIKTADSDTFAAKLQLESVSVGKLTVKNFEALVLKGGENSLLGMNFLNHFNHGIYNDELVFEKK